MQDQALTLQPQPEPSVSLMLQSIVDRGVTPENVAVMGQLIALKERMDAKQAEKDFASAFVKLQEELPVIVAQTVIPNRGKYERFEDVMEVLRPILARNGFGVAFAQSFQENRVVQTCELSHVGGHSKSNSFAVRVGGKADSDTQADCKASTTAKRNALLNALNIVIRQDYLNREEDPHNEGQHISAKDAAELRERVRECGADAGKFLQFAEAESFETIYEARMPALIDVLERREKSNRSGRAAK